MQTMTKNLTEVDAHQVIEIARRIQKVMLTEFPESTTYVLACSLHMLQTDIKTRFGIEVISGEPPPIQNN